MKENITLFVEAYRWKVTLGKCMTKDNLVITPVYRNINEWKMLICPIDIAVHPYSLSFIPHVMAKHWTYSTDSTNSRFILIFVNTAVLKNVWFDNLIFNIYLNLINPRLITNPSKYSHRGVNISQAICDEEWDFALNWAFWLKIKE